MKRKFKTADQVLDDAERRIEGVFDQPRNMHARPLSKPASKRKAKDRGVGHKLTAQQVLLGFHLAELGLEHVFEYRFLPDRKFRFDVYFSAEQGWWLPSLHIGHGVGIECDGGMWHGHRRGAAIEQDNEKINLAQANGFMCLRFTNRQIESGDAKEFIRKHILGERD